jgi:hypothetical protein
MSFPPFSPSQRGQRWKRCSAGLLAALLVASAFALSPAGAAGPYPDLSPCEVFPDPPASLSPRAPSLPTEAAWNQDISKAPRDSRSGAYIAYIDAHGGDSLHPDFGSPREYGFPYSVVGAGQRLLPVHYTAYGDESDPGPFPVPAGAPVEGGNGSDGDRHVIAVDTAECKLYELYRGFYKPTPQPHWDAGSGAAWDLGSDAVCPPAIPRPTPPGCRSSPGWSATTKSPPATSTTRSGSPSRAPVTPGSLPPATAPATPATATRRRWGPACGSRPATASAASPGPRGRSPKR